MDQPLSVPYATDDGGPPAPFARVVTRTHVAAAAAGRCAGGAGRCSPGRLGQWSGVRWQCGTGMAQHRGWPARRPLRDVRATLVQRFELCHRHVQQMAPWRWSGGVRTRQPGAGTRSTPPVFSPFRESGASLFARN
jgi:hypothetical protein